MVDLAYEFRQSPFFNLQPEDGKIDHVIYLSGLTVKHIVKVKKEKDPGFSLKAAKVVSRLPFENVLLKRNAYISFPLTD